VSDQMLSAYTCLISRRGSSSRRAYRLQRPIAARLPALWESRPLGATMRRVLIVLELLFSTVLQNLSRNFYQ
jgi:hypothetical protein